MTHQSNIDKRIKELEQKRAPEANRYICYVDVGEDCDLVVARFKQDNDVTDTDTVHVVQFVTPEMVRESDGRIEQKDL